MLLELNEEFQGKVKEIANKLLNAKNRLVCLRYHRDADGICGALLIEKIVRVRSFQQNTSMYGVKNALSDINMVYYEENPLMVFVDFGSGEGSLKGLETLKAKGIEVIVIDHHFPGNNVEEKAIILNSRLFGEEDELGSYTAGWICGEIAKAAGQKGEEIEILQRTACAGDKSEVMEFGEEDKQRALVMDYLASYSQFNNRLAFYKKVLKDKELYESLLRQAEDGMEETKEQIKRRMKAVEGKVKLYTINLEWIGHMQFPARGKSTTVCFETVKDEKEVVVVGYWKNGLSFRINKGAVEKGFGANYFIEELKKRMPDFLEGGGGHGRAAALRIRDGFGEHVVNEIKRIVQEE